MGMERSVSIVSGLSWMMYFIPPSGNRSQPTSNPKAAAATQIISAFMGLSKT